jgi:CHAD domain-containing protein
VLAARLLKRSRRFGASVDNAGQLYAPERLHDVRIATKKLRYSLEIAAEAGATTATPLLRPMKRTQDLLGRMHDLQILQSHVAAVHTGAGASRPGMHAALETLARHLEQECRHLHGRYLRSAGGLSELCGRVQSDVVQQLGGPGARRARRPIKMTLRRKGMRPATGGR